MGRYPWEEPGLGFCSQADRREGCSVLKKSPFSSPNGFQTLGIQCSISGGEPLRTGVHQNLVCPSLAFPTRRERAREQPRSLVKQTLVGPREELGEKSGRVAHQIPGFAARVVLRLFLAAGRARHSPATRAWGIPGCSQPTNPPGLKEQLALAPRASFPEEYQPVPAALCSWLHNLGGKDVI